MPSLKEIIVLVLVLSVSLTIYFFGPDSEIIPTPLSQVSGAANDRTARVENIFASFEKIEKGAENNDNGAVADNNFTLEASKSSDTNGIGDEKEIFAEEEMNTSYRATFLENIFNRVDDLVEKLKAKREDDSFGSKSCSICGGGEATVDSVMEDYLSSIGYQSWLEYTSSDDYQWAKEQYLLDEDDVSQNDSSICATILAQGGGGGGQSCTCDDADGTCYKQYAYYRYYHCKGSCCCACCIVCCGRG